VSPLAQDFSRLQIAADDCTARGADRHKAPMLCLPPAPGAVTGFCIRVP